MKKIKNWTKNSSGITLIALVITIIVLLILAGVSLSLIMGNDGILGRAENATTEHTNASIEEEIQLVIGDLTMEYYENEIFNTGVELDEYIIENIGSYPTTSGESITVDKDNKTLSYKEKTLTFDLANKKVEVEDSSTVESTVSMNEMYSVADLTTDDIADEELFNVEPLATSNGAKEARISLKNNVVTQAEDNYYDIGIEGDTFVVPYQVNYNGEAYKVTEVDLHVSAGSYSWAANFPGVKKLIYPNTVKKIIADRAPTAPEGTIGTFPLESVVLSNKLEEIPARLFVNATKLKNIVIPNSVKTIGYAAFYQCSELATVSIPSSVTTIDGAAFEKCAGLTSVTIPNSVTSIRYDSFRECTGLRSVIIEEGVTSIESSAFYGCTGLLDVTMPNSLTTIGGCAFQECASLSNIVIPLGVISIGDYAFDDCVGIRSLTIPSSVTSIGNGAFYGCGRLTSITINKAKDSISGSPWGAPSSATITWTGE